MTFNVTKTKNVETEDERWTRIIDEAWDETVTSEGKDYLFEDVSLQVDTTSLYIDYYEYFNLTNTHNKEELLIDSLSVKFNIDIHTLELEPNSGYIKMIEIKNINSDHYIHGFNGVALEEDFRNGTLKCRLDINCKDASIFGN